MKRASITEARNKLSALLERVRHGETVVIEDRGVAVARISAVAADSSADADAVARLERQGIVRPATAPAPSRLALTRPPRPARPGALSRLVVAERAEGW
jgi:prevent-host-death family protein